MVSFQNCIKRPPKDSAFEMRTPVSVGRWSIRSRQSQSGSVKMTSVCTNESFGEVLPYDGVAAVFAWIEKLISLEFNSNEKYSDRFEDVHLVFLKSRVAGVDFLILNPRRNDVDVIRG